MRALYKGRSICPGIVGSIVGVTNWGIMFYIGAGEVAFLSFLYTTVLICLLLQLCRFVILITMIPKLALETCHPHWTETRVGEKVYR
jgi:hypothetical protein